MIHELVVGFDYLVLSGRTVLVHQYHSSSCFSKSQKGIVWSVRDSLTWAYDFCRVSLFWVTNRRHSLLSALCRSSLFQASTFGVKDLVRKLVGIDFVVTIAILEWCDDWHKFNVRTSSYVCWGCLDLSTLPGPWIVERQNPFPACWQQSDFIWLCSVSSSTWCHAKLQSSWGCQTCIEQDKWQQQQQPRQHTSTSSLKSG